MKEKKYPISPKNQKDLTQFLDSIKAEGTDNKSTLTNYETSIRKILYLLDKDISKITVTDLDKVFSNISDTGTRELNKIYFKKYLKFKKRKTLAEHIKINAKYFKESTKTANDVLSEDEINKVLNSRNSNRDLAIFELFLTTGIRREELSTLNIKNIQILKDEIKVEVTKSKTIKRTISIIPYPNNPISSHFTIIIHLKMIIINRYFIQEIIDDQAWNLKSTLSIRLFIKSVKRQV
jgi:site-specific recombinase XerD